MEDPSTRAVAAVFHGLRAAKNRRHVEGEDRLLAAMITRATREQAARAEARALDEAADRDAVERGWG